MDNYTAQIEYRDINSIIPYHANCKQHPPEQVNLLASMIKEYGHDVPIVVDKDGVIIKGHGRLEACKKLNMQQVPVIVRDDLTPAQVKAARIADNKVAESPWDNDSLKLELLELDELGFDLELTGFSLDDFEFETEPTIPEDADVDAVPDAPEEPVTKLGDVWLLGNHRLMCGDSTSQSDIDKLMDGANWDVCVFDPPYEIEGLYNDAMPPTQPNKKLIVFWDFKRFAIAAKAALDAGWKSCYELIWDNYTSWYTPNRPLARHKACGVFGDDEAWNFEQAIIKDGKKREPKKVSNTRGVCDYVPLDGAVHLSTVFQKSNTQTENDHKHSKPTDWIIAIFNGCGGESYLDLFGGGGTTLICCELTKRKSFTMELDPRNCDVIIERAKKILNIDAVLL